MMDAAGKDSAAELIVGEVIAVVEATSVGPGLPTEAATIADEDIVVE